MDKIFLLTLSLMVLALPASAQFYPDGRPIPPRHRAAYYGVSSVSNSLYDDAYFSLRVGLGLAQVNSDSKYLDGSDFKAGLNVGVAAGVLLTNRAPLYFETGLYYTEKGGKQKYEGSKFTYNLDYLELPLLLKYKYYLSHDVSIDPFVGGYLACGVAGKIKNFQERAAYGSFDSDYDDNFKRFDGGIKLGCSVSFQMLYFGVSYDIGLANVGKDDFDETHNGCLNFDIGVTF